MLLSPGRGYIWHKYVLGKQSSGPLVGCFRRKVALIFTPICRFRSSSAKKMQPRTGYLWDERYNLHDTGTHVSAEPAGFYPTLGIINQPFHHAESAESKARIHTLLAASGILDHCLQLRARPATRKELERFHLGLYIDSVKHKSDHHGGDAGECAPIGRGSYDVALYAVGGCIEAVDAVLNKQVRNAYCLVRPPGHHAEADRGRGFCLFANVALAAMHAMEARGLKRVAVVDYDVHHGNGTEQAFYERDDVLFISIHQHHLYPIDSGDQSARGAGKGEGFNINIPLPPGTGVGGYEATFTRVVVPALRAFQPELILVSSGFDAGAMDPLSHQMLTADSFGWMAQQMIQVAEDCCDGRIVFCHEGGYNPAQTPFCGLRVVEALTGLKTNVLSPSDHEILEYGYQQLQHHQDAVIKIAEGQVEKLKAKLTSTTVPA